MCSVCSLHIIGKNVSLEDVNSGKQVIMPFFGKFLVTSCREKKCTTSDIILALIFYLCFKCLVL